LTVSDVSQIVPLRRAAGRFVRLEPLRADHQDDILKAVSDGQLWNHYFLSVPNPQTVASWIRAALDDPLSIPLVIRRLSDQPAQECIVGSTRLFAIDLPNKRAEIGHTFLSESAWRTGINTDTKLLLLEHAFEVMGLNAVEFRTHSHNQRSRDAILRLGASLDGILRHHRILPDGALRDTCVYSILKSEWPGIRIRLQDRLHL